jgi:hypothetical protein
MSRNCPVQIREGRTLPEACENLKEAVEIIIKANRELTRLEIGSDAISEIAGGGMNEAPHAALTFEAERLQTFARRWQTFGLF